jgi:hypothetical protein
MTDMKRQEKQFCWILFIVCALFAALKVLDGFWGWK